MNKLRLGFCAALFITLTLSFASLSQAQVMRTWVSGVGDDANPCSRTHPCKTFAGALFKTPVNGEISALDSGGFGSVFINKSVTIDGTGVLAGAILLGDGPPLITINITAASDTAKSVRLRGLSLNGVLKAGVGVNVKAAHKVLIEDCVISNFKEIGIAVSAGTVYVRNTTVSYNGRHGIHVTGGQVGLNDVSVIFNGVGLVGEAGIVRHNNVVLFGNSH